MEGQPDWAETRANRLGFAAYGSKFFHSSFNLGNSRFLER